MDKVLHYTLREEDLAGTADGLVNLVLKNCVRVTGHEISAAKFAPDGITCDGSMVRVTDRIRPGQTLRVVLPEEKDAQKLIPTEGPVRILYEDEDLLAVDKAPGEVVHPGPGHYADTIANHVTRYLQKRRGEHPYTCPDGALAGNPKGPDGAFVGNPKGPDGICTGDQQGLCEEPAGDREDSGEAAEGESDAAGLRIIGRLDKETSGVLLFAKNRAAAARLQRQRREGVLVRTYLAVCEGTFPDSAAALYGKSGTIDLPLEKVPGVLMKMRIAEEQGLRAVTHYEVIAEGKCIPFSVLRVTIETGRTHQIRVHLASIGHPLIGDTLYGSDAPQQEHTRSMPDMRTGGGEKRERPAAGTPQEPDSGPDPGPRALLHACELCLRQPFTGEEIRITSPLPADMRPFLSTHA